MRWCQLNPEVLFIPTCGNVNHCYVINSIDSPVPDPRASAKKQKAKGTCTVCTCVCACVRSCVFVRHPEVLLIPTRYNIIINHCHVHV